jgi:hypothetical protein
MRVPFDIIHRPCNRRLGSSMQQLHKAEIMLAKGAPEARSPPVPFALPAMPKKLCRAVWRWKFAFGQARQALVHIEQMSVRHSSAFGIDSPMPRGIGLWRSGCIATRCPPRSEPAISHSFLPRAMEGPLCPYQPRCRGSLPFARAAWPLGSSVLLRMRKTRGSEKAT